VEKLVDGRMFVAGDVHRDRDANGDGTRVSKRHDGADEAPLPNIGVADGVGVSGE